MNRRTILFYSSVATRRQFSTQRFYRTDICLLRDLGYTVRLSKSWLDFLAFWNYDIAFIYFYRFGLLPALIARLTGRSVLFTGGIDYLDRTFAGLKSYLLQVMFFNLCGALAHENIIVSDADLTNCNKVSYIFSRSKNIVSKHCIDVADYACTDTTSRSKHVVTIAWMARLENVTRKGVLETIQLFKKIRDRDRDFRLFIIGPIGDGTAAVESMIRQLGLEGSVTITGELPEAEKIFRLKSSTVYTQLSKYEGFGIASIEALAAGNIVIHSNLGGLKEAIGENGIIWNNNDDACITRLFERLEDAEFYRASVNKGLDYVDTHYAYRRRLETFKAIFSRLGMA